MAIADMAGALSPVTALALVGVAGVGAQWLAWRFRMPAIVLMLAAGLLLGPLTGIFVPERDIGALTAPLVRTYPYMGHSIIVTAFIIIIVGGVGSLEGAVIAAVAYAFVHTFVTTFVDGVMADIVGLTLMLLVLIVKPTGLSGSRERA